MLGQYRVQARSGSRRLPYRTERPIRLIRRLAAVWLAIGALAGPAHAQRAGPDATDPSEIRPRLEGIAPEPRAPEAEPEVDLVRPSEPEEAPAAAAFVLSGVTVNGASAFDLAAFVPIYEPYLTQEVGEAEIGAIVAGIQALYEARGFFLTRVVAPPQDAAFGVLRIQVIEGYIETVSFGGDERAAERLSGYARPITEQRPLTLSVLERQLFLMSDLPGVALRAAIEPVDASTGAFRLDLEASLDTVQGSAYLDNRGTRSVGRVQGWLGGGFNDGLGLGERIEGLVFTVPDRPEELVYGQLGYAQPIGVDGLVAAVTAAGSLSEPGAALAPFDIESSSLSVSARATYPLVRAREQSLWLYGAFNVLNARADSKGDTFLKDRLRVAQIGFDYLLADAWDGTNQVNLGLSKGLGILDASGRSDPLRSRSDGRADFLKVVGEITRQQAIIDPVSIVASASGQYSSVPLLSAEEFSIGGDRFGRAYDFAELKGEHGIAASVELRYGGHTEWEPLSEYQLYTFWDAGSVWNERAGRGSLRQSLMSAGGGVRLALSETVFLGLEIAKPFHRTPANEGDLGPRVFFSLSTDL
jgi:hemolysin activation/secretion protein